MAEAVVDERTPMPTRFYCHMCSVEINIPNTTDYTCPLCAGGFVEELPALPPGSNSGVASGSTSATSINDGSSSGSDALGFNRLSDLDAIRGEIATLLMSRNGPSVEISIDPGNQRSVLMSSGSGTSGAGGGGGGGSTGGGRVHPHNFDNALLDFLQSLTAHSGIDTPFGNPQMLFVGNPGDYAWGREGIDTIVTQLLNQMETSGPPPLAKDKIAEIPKVEVTAVDVERKVQCSVCWEDFQMHEIVRKLPCSHIYHENCIVPWLDLHGTCPICRKSLTDEDVEGAGDSSMDSGEGSSGGAEHRTDCPMFRTLTNTHSGGGSNIGGEGAEHRTNCPMFRTASNVVGAAPSSTATSTSTNTGTGSGSAANTSQQTQNQRNNVFGFDDGNVDLD